MSSLKSIDSLQSLDGVSSTHAQVTTLPDVFSQKIGDWAFSSVAPAVKNKVQDVPSGYALRPIDAGVMDYLEKVLDQAKGLPAAHLYDAALEVAYQKMADGPAKQVVGQDIELRDYLRARRIGEVYE